MPCRSLIACSTVAAALAARCEPEPARTRRPSRRCAHPLARRRSRNIGKFTGSSVVGVTLNQYQVDRGNALCKKAGLAKCKLVKVRAPSTSPLSLSLSLSLYIYIR